MLSLNERKVAAAILLPACLTAVGVRADVVADTVEVTATRLSPTSGLFHDALAENEVPVSQTTVTASAIELRQPDRVEVLLQQLAGAVPAQANAGLSTAVQVRGFDIASQIQYDGHPDIQRLFVRDLATVDRVEVLKGHLSVLYGQGAPGATVNYVGKEPQGSGDRQLALAVDDHGMRRAVVDLDGAATPAAPFTWRLVVAGQAGDTWIDNVKADRRSWFGSLKWRLPGKGSLRVEAERQENERPFSFGTVYVDGHFMYDKSYVAPVAESDRRYDRYGVYLDQPMAADWRLEALWSAAEVKREETLAGFWSIVDAHTLSGYYRQLTDAADQNDARIALHREIAAGTWRHHVQGGWQRDSQDIDFSGPQNIAGFTIDVDHPDFAAVDFSSLPLWPRVSREHQRERGLFLFDRVEAGSRARLMAGIRQSRMSIVTDNGSVTRQATDLDHVTATWGALYKVADDSSLYVSRSGSFLPNRGLDRFGGFLPPKVARQVELGWHAGGADYLHAAVFDIRQDNLTAPDPLDKTALVAVGRVRSRGLELAFRRSLSPAWAVSGQCVAQRVRNELKTDPSYGDQIAGVPAVYGAVSLDWQLNPGTKGWATLVGVGSRWGDAYGSFRAPGYVRADLGVRHVLSRDSDVGVAVVNLSDKRYVEYLSAADNVFQGARRSLTFAFRHQF